MFYPRLRRACNTLLFCSPLTECPSRRLVQFYVAICPPTGGFNDAAGFFQVYLALPVVLAFWAGGYLWKREGWLRTSQIDVDTGRRELNWEEINAYKAEIAAMPTWRRWVHRVFI